MTSLSNNYEFATAEEKFQHLIAQAPVFIVTLNGPTFIVETANKIALNIWGKSFEEVFNKPLFESSPEIESVFKPIFDHVYTTGVSFTANEIAVQLKRTGKPDTAYFDMVYQPLRYSDNNIYGIIAIGTETTDAVKARKEIEASEQFSRTILESSPDGIKVLDVEGCIQYINLNGLRQLEIDDFSTVKSKNWCTLWPSEQKELIKTSIEKALKGETTKFTALRRTVKNTPKWWDVVVSPVIKPGEPVQQIIAVSRDITQQKEAELRLTISEEKYRSLFESMDQGLSIVEMIYDENNNPVDLRYIETNPVFKEQSGLPDVLNKTLKELVPDIDDFWIETYAKVVLTGEPVRFRQEAPAMKSWFDVNAFRLGEEGSKQVAILFTNITHQKKSQAALDKIAADLKLATDSANVGIWSLNVQNQELEWSALHKKMWGYDEHRTDLTYEDWHSIILPEHKEMVFKRVEEAKLNHSLCDVEYRIKRPNDQTVCWIKAVGQFYYNDAGEAITLTGITIDITEQKKSEQAIEKIASHFKLATDSANVGIWSLNVQNQELEWSALHKKMWGYDEHRIDLTYEDWHAIIVEEDKAMAFQKVEEAKLNHTLYEVEYRIKRPNDTVIRWMKSFGHFYYNEAGEAITFTGISIDTTEQKSFTEELEKKVAERTEELRVQTKQLEEANRTLDVNNIALENANAELKSFSYVASHDLQEPLRLIKAFSQRIIKAENFSDKTQQYFKFIIDASERMGNLIVSLIDYSRIDKTELNFVPCDLNRIIEESKIYLQLRIAEKQAIIEYGKLPLLSGLHLQLCQLFTNIIGNAIKYCRPEIIPHVYITWERIEGNKIEHPAATQHLDYHAIKIADNGIGFKEENASKIFEPFQRLHTNSEYTGTGIGLSIVKKIVTNHNGFIVAEGVPNVGSTFTIYLPAINA